MTSKRTLQIPTELVEWLEKEALTQHRTLEGQVTYILEKYRARMTRGVPVIERGSVVAMQRFA